MDDERFRIMRSARATVDRLNGMPTSEPRDPGLSDALEQWARNMPKPEPKPKRESKLDTMPINWDAVINQRVTDMKGFVMEVLAAALRESFEIERGAYADALKKRDAKIAQLETELAKQAAQTARLEVRVIQNEIADHERNRSVDDGNKTIDLPAWPRKNVN
jgi:hypothetical protein